MPERLGSEADPQDQRHGPPTHNTQFLPEPGEPQVTRSVSGTTQWWRGTLRRSPALSGFTQRPQRKRETQRGGARGDQLLSTSVSIMATTGLHFDNVRKLLEVLHRLVEQGNSLVVIEHNLDVIKTAEWIVDLGLEGATRAGRSWRWGRPSKSPRRSVLIPAATSSRFSPNHLLISSEVEIVKSRRSPAPNAVSAKRPHVRYCVSGMNTQ